MIPGTPGIRTLAGLCLLAIAPTASAQLRHNVLLIVADDVGVDQIGAYGVGADLPNTPTINALAGSGMLFRNAWGNPVCSPTRATILTGRYSLRTGIGRVVQPGDAPLPLDEITIPEMLDSGTGGSFGHAAFGKWHLGDDPMFGGTLLPNLAGFSHFAGVMDNLPETLGGYFSWTKVVDGVAARETGYITTDTVDDAIEWIEHWRRISDDPWFCFLSFNAAHSPFHEPPSSLHTVDLSMAGPPNVDSRPYYKAMVEAMDTEIGRLLQSIGTQEFFRTMVVFLGDNGTPFEVTVPPFDPGHAKATPFEGGIRVPLIVNGPLVAQQGTQCEALVQTTDLFATVAEIAGVDPIAQLPLDRHLDSVSMVPYFRDPARPSIRRTAFAEIYRPNGFGPYERTTRAIRNERFKLIKVWTPMVPLFFEGLFDLVADPFELNNLLVTRPLSPEAKQAYDTLRQILADLVAQELSPPIVND